MTNYFANDSTVATYCSGSSRVTSSTLSVISSSISVGIVRARLNVFNGVFDYSFDGVSVLMFDYCALGDSDRSRNWSLRIFTALSLLRVSVVYSIMSSQSWRYFFIAC